MALIYVLDEHLRGALWKGILGHNAHGLDLIDAVRVGDPPDLPLGNSDSANLLWAEKADRILVSFDKRTMAGHFADHLRSGHHSPGVFLLRPGSRLGTIVDTLAYYAHHSNPAAWADRIVYIP